MKSSATTSKMESGRKAVNKVIRLDGQLHQLPLATSQKITTFLGAEQNDKFICLSDAQQVMHELFLAIYLDFVRETGRTHILSLPGKTAAVSSALRRMEKLGCTVKPLALNARGQVTRESLEESIRTRTGLVTLSWADPFTGVIQPVLELGAICKQKGVLFHVDASSVIGKLFFRFQDLPVDFLTFSEPACGLLVKGEKFLKDLEASREVPLAVEHAFAECAAQQDHLCMETARLKMRLEKEIIAHVPEARVLFQDSDRVPNISAISFPGVHAEALQFYLQKQGIYASCADFTALSFTLTHSTTEEEIDYLLEKLISAVKKLRACSSQLVSPC